MSKESMVALLSGALAVTGCWKMEQVESSGVPDATTDTAHDTGWDTGWDTVEEPGWDTATEWDTSVDWIVDTVPDAIHQCSDYMDNDGDDLIDMDDNDCTSPEDDIEGSEVGECTTDNHCDAGWSECNIITNVCYTPPMALPCSRCETRADCGDGITDEDHPDVDWCVMSGPSGGTCTKDCREDYDCPRGYFCDGLDAPPGMCLPISDCEDMYNIGASCGSSWDCGWGSGLSCIDNVCTYECETQHECPSGAECLDGVCVAYWDEDDPVPPPG